MKKYFAYTLVLILLNCTFTRLLYAQEIAIDGLIVTTDGKPVNGAKVSINGRRFLASTAQGKFKVYLSKGDLPKSITVKKKGFKLKDWSYEASKKSLRVIVTNANNLLRGLVQENGRPLRSGEVILKLENTDYKKNIQLGKFNISLPDEYKVPRSARFIVNKMPIDPDWVEWHDGDTYVIIKKPDHLPNQVNEVLVSDQNFKPIPDLEVRINGQIYTTKKDGSFAVNMGTKSTDSYEITDYTIIKSEYDKNSLIYNLFIQEGKQTTARISEDDTPKETVIPITTDYTDDFHRITEELEREKEALIESREHIIEEIEKIGKQLDTDRNLTSEVRKSLQAELTFLEKALEENDRTYQEAQNKTNYVIDKMRKVIQEKDSLHDVAQEQLKIIEKEKQEIEEQKEIIEAKSRKNFIIFLTVSLSLTGLVFIAYVFIRKFRAKNLQLQEQEKQLRTKNLQLQEQEKQLRESNDAFQAANTELGLQKALVEKKNQDITASITYAKRIQRSMLPDIDMVKMYLPESFIFFRPRDIVSGDFYWLTSLADDENLTTIIVAADCTGHGVPGAFMSMVGDALLNQIIKLQQYTEPDKILRELNIGVRSTLRQDETENRDGMDVVICTIQHHKKKVDFAGAKNPLFYVQNNQIFEIKGSRKSIGGRQSSRLQLKYGDYERHTIDIDQPTVFYLASDGYPDQFGGVEGKKFSKKQFRKLLLDIHSKPFAQQAKITERTIEEWKGDTRQIDDILVIGFKIE